MAGDCTRLDGKVALVTGGGRGIGRAIALGLAEQGAAVAVVARTESEVHGVVREIRALGGQGIALTADVTSREHVEASVATTERALGSIDVLVNNAGYSTLGRFHEIDPDDWWRVIEVNVRGVYWFCRATVPKMLEKDWGRIVNISSVAGKTGMPYGSAYCSAKHAVLGITRALALEVAQTGVTVNAVCPGLVHTEMTAAGFRQVAELLGIPPEVAILAAIQNVPQKRAITPEEIVPAVLFLVSPAAARTTGEALNVSGGKIMH
jgi:NAD(P)-dependent dehydrogenase (short-subunit alcohol dehydrogenase family)